MTAIPHTLIFDRNRENMPSLWRPIRVLENSFGKGVQNWWRKGCANCRGYISIRFFSCAKKSEGGRSASPPSGRGLKEKLILLRSGATRGLALVVSRGVSRSRSRGRSHPQPSRLSITQSQTWLISITICMQIAAASLRPPQYFHWSPQGQWSVKTLENRNEYARCGIANSAYLI